MLLQFIQILYVLVAIAIIAFVLLQQGSGAQAGSGFGGGASATVFGARGASNFLSKSTKWLAITFFVISLGMAWYATNRATTAGPVQQDLGVMSQAPAATPAGDDGVPAAPAQAAPQSAAPAAAPDDSTVPAAPATPPPQQPAPAGG